MRAVPFRERVMSERPGLGRPALRVKGQSAPRAPPGSPFIERRPERGPWVHGHEPRAGELAILLGQGVYRAAHVLSR